MATQAELEADCGVEDREPDVTVENPKQIRVGDDLELVFIGTPETTYWYGYIVEEGEGGCYRATEYEDE